MPEFTSDWFSHAIPHWDQFLRPLTLRGEPLNILEIGSHEGRSTLWLLDNLCNHQKTRLTCIDPWGKSEYERRFDANVAESRNRNKMQKIKGYSGVELRRLPIDEFESLDLVYVDGSHEGCDCLRDGVLTFPMLKVGGLMVFDDYLWNGAHRYHTPKPAIDAFLLLWDFQIDVLHHDYQVIARKKTRPFFSPGG